MNLINFLSVTQDVTRIEYNATLESNILACGNKKQKMKSINNHFHMPWHVEIDIKEVT